MRHRTDLYDQSTPSAIPSHVQSSFGGPSSPYAYSVCPAGFLISSPLTIARSLPLLKVLLVAVAVPANTKPQKTALQKRTVADENANVLERPEKTLSTFPLVHQTIPLQNHTTGIMESMILRIPKRLPRGMS